MNVSIVIPAYNEEKNIGRTLQRVFSDVTIDYEVMVVTDHCTDNTEQLVRDLQPMHPQLKLLTNRGNRGFGNTLITGFEQAQGDAVVPIMADCCDDPSTVNRMWQKLSTEPFDVVCGSRYMKGGVKISGPWIQDKMSRLVCFSLRLLTRVPTRDCANSYKMYKKSFLNTINYRIADAGTEYSMALLFRAFYAGARITEIPTVWAGNRIPWKREWRIFKRTPGYWRWYKLAVSKTLRWIGIGKKS